MAGEIRQALRLGLLHEDGQERLVGEREDDVHAAAGFGRDAAHVEVAHAVDGVVEKGRALLRATVHLGDAALLVDPAGHQHGGVELKHGRRVLQAVVPGVDAPVEHLRHGFGGAAELVAAHDHASEARGAEVLLNAGPDGRIAGPVDGTAHEVTRHVGDEESVVVVNGGQALEFGAVDRFVVAEVDVLDVARNMDHVRRQLAVVASPERRLAGDAAALLARHARPGARDDVAAAAPLGDEVERHHGELRLAAARAEEDLEVVGHGQKRLHAALELEKDRLEGRLAVHHLENGVAVPLVVDDGVGNAFENGLRQHARTGGEVEGTTHDYLQTKKRRNHEKTDALQKSGASVYLRRSRQQLPTAESCISFDPDHLRRHRRRCRNRSRESRTRRRRDPHQRAGPRRRPRC